MRRASTWALILPLVIAGSQAGHGLAYWWAYPQARLRLAVLQHSGHGYLAFAPVALGITGAVELVVCAFVVADRLHGRPVRRLPPWAFVLLPALTFVVQEHVERFVASGLFPWWAVLAPTFWRGLLLQIPVGLAAYLIARLLLRTAESVARIVESLRPAVPVGLLAPVRRAVAVALVRPAPLAASAAGRAPPLPSR
ncbi:MAG TPA: hypothetical protein VFA30_05670 [Gaiellaceae bacterium]|nr:hypothetical protein [Gaiellaceae bacterium]